MPNYEREETDKKAAALARKKADALTSKAVKEGHFKVKPSVEAMLEAIKYKQDSVLKAFTFFKDDPLKGVDEDEQLKNERARFEKPKCTR